MDDLELEARLRDRLHRRFDDAAPSADLTTAVAAVVATSPDRLRWTTGGIRRLGPGWAVAAVAVVVTAVVAANYHPSIGPAKGNNPSPTPTPLTAPRLFPVLSRSIEQAARDEAGEANNILFTRLRTLGVADIGASTNVGIIFDIRVAEPSDAAIRDLLDAPGEVEFVPLPAADYGEGGLVAEPGKPLPKDEPALFGWEGIASAGESVDQLGRPTLAISLTPAAAQTFADYTTRHVNEYLAIVVDGVVGLLPVITSPITGGEIELSGGEDEDLFVRTRAILVGGRLPASWRAHDAPAILSEAAAIDVALRAHPGANGQPRVGARDLDIVGVGEQWRAVWMITLRGEFPGECVVQPAGAPTDCPVADSVRLTLDAVTGSVIASEAPAPF